FVTTTAEDTRNGYAAGNTSLSSGLEGSAVIDTMNSQVSALIGAGANVQAVRTTSAPIVKVDAEHTINRLAQVGAYLNAPTTGIGAAFDATSYDRSVVASIASGATVSSTGHVGVNASATDTFTSGVAGLGTAAGQEPSLIGSFAVLFLQSQV